MPRLSLNGYRGLLALALLAPPTGRVGLSGPLFAAAGLVVLGSVLFGTYHAPALRYLVNAADLLALLRVVPVQ